MIGKAMMLLATAFILLSFSSNFGGEGFEILLNGKVILQQFGKDLNTVKELQLKQSSPTDKLTIRYHHCGRVGKNRIVTIKDGQDKMLKEWHFRDLNTNSDMSCSVQDILSLKKNNNSVFKVYYSSSELPGGRLLTSVILGNNITVHP